MIFTNANDTNKKEDSMLSYYNYTPSKTFITYENNNNNNNDNKNNFLIKNKELKQNYNNLKKKS